MKMSLEFLIFLLLFGILPVQSQKKSTNQLTDKDRQKFQSWKQRHQKVYKTKADEERAMSNMVNNLREIEAHNQLYEAGKVSYSRAVWEHSDLSSDEKRQLLAGQKSLGNVENVTKSGRLKSGRFQARPIPSEVNWVKEGRVASVLNQGKCGSCWTFAAAGVVEGVLRANGDDTRVSEQYIVDCARNGGNAGCNGGDSYQALKYVASNGFPSASDYPYTGKSGRCQGSSMKKVKLKVGSIKYERLRGNEKRLKEIVASYGPTAVAIRAADNFLNYKAGIYDYPKCSKDLDHAVLVVGYGTDDKSNKDYWLVKNSWGTSWGEDGYVRMIRNSNNQCGIASEAVYIITRD